MNWNISSENWTRSVFLKSWSGKWPGDRKGFQLSFSAFAFLIRNISQGGFWMVDPHFLFRVSDVKILRFEIERPISFFLALPEKKRNVVSWNPMFRSDWQRRKLKIRTTPVLFPLDSVHFPEISSLLFYFMNRQVCETADLVKERERNSIFRARDKGEKKG